MYKDFEVRNFRCFKDIRLTDLTRINLITGLNNAGKTALLEALFIHSGAYNPSLTLRVNAFRGLENIEVTFGPGMHAPWDSLFRNYDVNNPIELIAFFEEGVQSKVKLRVVQEPAELTQIYQRYLQRKESPTSLRSRKERRNSYKIEKKTGSANIDNELDYLSTAAKVLEFDCSGGKYGKIKYYYIFDRTGQRVIPIPPAVSKQSIIMPARLRSGEDIERFGLLETLKKQNTLLNILQIMEPRLKQLALVIEDGNPVIQGDIGLERLLPLALMGEGTSRLASIVLAIASAKDGMVLIDEVENGFHYSVLPKVWNAISEASIQFNTQIFLTTHSLECIIAANETFKKNIPSDFRLHRLESAKGNIEIITYDQESLSAAIDSGFEVR